jgi:hypothetical protein
LPLPSESSPAWISTREGNAPCQGTQLNPDEGVNGDLKQAVTRQEPARSKAQLKRAAIGHMRKLSKLPDRIRSFFRHKTFRYAA